MRRMKRNSFDNMFDSMQNMFEEVQDRGLEMLEGRVPVDIRDEDGEIVVKADLPGVSKEDINLRADEESLEISAESSTEIEEKNEKYLRRERSSRSFRRTVSWPTSVEVESISAEFEDGVLTVTAEKTESSGKDIDIE